MKKTIIVLLCFLFSFCVFAGCEQAEESKTDISNSDISEISEASDEISEVSEEKNFVIIDKRNEHDGWWNDGLDVFFDDDNWIYSFPNTSMCLFIIVEYSDGTTQNVKEALEDGNITIQDLDRFGIGYMKEPKDTSN